MLPKNFNAKPCPYSKGKVIHFLFYLLWLPLLWFPLQVHSVVHECSNCQAIYNDENFADCPLCSVDSSSQSASAESSPPTSQAQAIKLFTLIAAAQNCNLVFSPASTYGLLSLILSVATDNTLSMLQNFLPWENLPASGSEQGAAGEQDKVEEQGARGQQDIYSEANAVIVSSGVTLQEGYREEVNQQSNTVLHEGVEFSDPQALRNLAERINQYFCENTRGVIPEACKPDEWESNTAVSFMNSVYFHGLWERKFDSAFEFKFTLADGTKVYSDGMEQNINNGQMASYNEWRAVAVSYRGDHEMFFILPPNDIMPHQATPEIIAGLFSSFQTYNSVHVEMPSFETISKINLLPPLSQAGLECLFEPHVVSLGGMISGLSMPITLNDIRQDCAIKVDRKGTEAAAVTKAKACFLSRRRYKNEIIFNRPYLYLLRNKKTGKILFLGQVLNPRSEADEDSVD